MYQCPRHKDHLIISFAWTTIFSVVDSLSVTFVSVSSVDPVTQHHLVAFSSYSYRTNYDLPSYLYRWNNSRYALVSTNLYPALELQTSDFFADRELYLAIACSMNSTKQLLTKLSHRYTFGESLLLLCFSSYRSHLLKIYIRW